MSKADDIFWREFGVILLGLVLFTVIVFVTARTIGANSFERMQNSPDAVLARIQPFGQVRVGKSDQVVAAAEPAGSAPAGAAPAAASSGGGDGEAIYSKACVACHSTGVAGAPKVGDKAAWEPRLAQGLDGLVGSAVKGKGAMPPKGGQMSLTDDDVKSAVQFMLENTGVKPG